MEGLEVVQGYGKCLYHLQDLKCSEGKLRSIHFGDVRRTRDRRKQEVEGTYCDVVEDIRELFPE